jgi:hypothetical protein
VAVLVVGPAHPDSRAPGGFRRPRKPRTAGGRRRQREAEAAQLRLAAIFRVGAVIMGAAIVVVAALVIALVIAEH